VGKLHQDLRLSARQLRQAPGFAAVAVLTLGLGIGATSMLFSVVHGVLLRPLPYPQPERIVRVFEIADDGHRPSQMSDPNFLDLAEQSRSFEALAQFQTSLVSLSGGTDPARVVAAQVSRDFWRVLGVEPYLGRTFEAAEQQEGVAPVALVSHGFWQRSLGGGSDLSTYRLRSGGEAVSVVGVMPPGFDFPEGAELWVPRELESITTSRTALNKKVVGRLAAGVPLASARREASGVARRLADRYGDDTGMADLELVRLRDVLVGDTRRPLLLLFAASALLLAIACANVVNLLLARASSRRPEIGVRIALGAGRLRLTQQSLTESLLLALLGASLGVLLAHWGVDLLRALAHGRLPRVQDIRVDGTVLLFSLAVALTVAGGLALLVAWRSMGDGVRSPLAAGERTQAGSATTRVRGALVVSQIAMTLVLLVGAGLLLRSLQGLLGEEAGYRTEGAVALNCYLPYPESSEEAERQASLQRRIMSRLAALPGVGPVGGVDALPLRGRGADGTFLRLEHPDEVTDWEGFGRMAKIAERAGYAEYRKATPGYFGAMRIPLLRGRTFERRDQPGAAHVAVVSESLAEISWPGEDPLGKLVQFGNMDGDLRPFTVVGVVGDVRDESLEAEPRPTFYANAEQRPRGLSGPFDIVLVGERSAASLVGAARGAVRELAPEAAPTVETLDEILTVSLAERRFQLLLLGIFGGAALLLALVGIYGVVSFQVAQRKQEIGVRLALGATGERVAWMILRRGLLLASLGIAVGVAGALAASGMLRSLLYGVAPNDPPTFLAVALLLVTAALLACFLPALRAARVDPAVVLRAQ
jgi:putative ABC transport system permease protein